MGSAQNLVAAAGVSALLVCAGSAAPASASPETGQGAKQSLSDHSSRSQVEPTRFFERTFTFKDKLPFGGEGRAECITTTRTTGLWRKGAIKSAQTKQGVLHGP